MKTEILNVKDLTPFEKKDVTGGNPVIIFIVGAIAGGLVYDIYKAVSLGLIKVQTEHPEYYDGPVHSLR
jgi:hypothetical protein